MSQDSALSYSPKHVFQLFETYFGIFLHPFKTHAELRRRRLEKNKVDHGMLKVVDGVHEENNFNTSMILDTTGPKIMTFAESLSVSWIFVLVKTLYTLVSIHMGVHIFNYVSGDSRLKDLFLPNIRFQSQKILIFWVLMEVVLFPIVVWFYIKFWSVIIRFFSNLFETDSDEDSLNQTLSHSLSANAFLLIPIFGDFARHLCSLFFIFAGLRNNLGMTQLQSLLVMISPLFIFMGFFLMSFVYMFMMLSLI